MPTQSTHPRPSGAAPLVHYPLLTAEQVMHLFLMSRTSLWILMHQLGLPYIKVCKGSCAALRFTSDSLSRWLAAREQQSPSA